MNEANTIESAVSRGGMVFGIVLVVLGMLSIAAPLISGVAIVLLVGVFMIAGGIARMLWAFRSGSFGRGLLSVVLGGLFILAGALVLARPLIGLASLTMLLAVFFLMDGVFEIMAAFKLKPTEGWWWLLVGGIASLVLGFMIWRQWPLSGAWATGVLVGIKMLFAGIEMIGLVTATSSPVLDND